MAQTLMSFESLYLTHLMMIVFGFLFLQTLCLQFLTTISFGGIKRKRVNGVCVFIFSIIIIRFYNLPVNQPFFKCFFSYFKCINSYICHVLFFFQISITSAFFFLHIFLLLLLATLSKFSVVSRIVSATMSAFEELDTRM